MPAACKQTATSTTRTSSRAISSDMNRVRPSPRQRSTGTADDGAVQHVATPRRGHHFATTTSTPIALTPLQAGPSYPFEDRLSGAPNQSTKNATAECRLPIEECPLTNPKRTDSSPRTLPNTGDLVKNQWWWLRVARADQRDPLPGPATLETGPWRPSRTRTGRPELHRHSIQSYL